MNGELNSDRALLGAVLSGYPNIDDLSAVVSPADFADPRDELVWGAILHVHAAGSKPDPLTVRAAIGSDGWTQLREVGGPLYLIDLASRCPNPVEAPSYARMAADNAKRRQLNSAIYAIGEDLRDTDRPVSQIAEQARNRIDSATLDAARHTARTYGSYLPEVCDTAQHGTVQGLPTGWAGIDDLIGGLAPGRLIIVGARPGGGKSLMGTNLALAVSGQHGHDTLLCSMEMPGTEVAQRLTAAHARVSLTALTAGQMAESAWARIADKITEAEVMPITIDDASTQTLTSIRIATREAARTAERASRKLALVVVD